MWLSNIVTGACNQESLASAFELDWSVILYNLPSFSIRIDLWLVLFASLLPPLVDQKWAIIKSLLSICLFFFLFVCSCYIWAAMNLLLPFSLSASVNTMRAILKTTHLANVADNTLSLKQFNFHWFCLLNIITFPLFTLFFHSLISCSI